MAASRMWWRDNIGEDLQTLNIERVEDLMMDQSKRRNAKEGDVDSFALDDKALLRISISVKDWVKRQVICIVKVDRVLGHFALPW